MKFYELGRSFFRKMVQIRSNFATTCTIKGTRGAKLPIDATFSESLEKSLDKVVSREEKNFSVHKKYMNFFQYRKTALDEHLYKLSAGRSMVEMLGVLAIIGVLSVGAISGYSKAMMKYKLNKQSEQISTVIYNSMTTADQFSPPPPNPGSSSVENMTSIYIKLGLIPDEMIKSTDTAYVYDVFNNPIRFANINWGDFQYLQTSITFSINSNSRQDVAECMNVFNIFKAMDENIYDTSIARSFSQGDQTSSDIVSQVSGTLSCGLKSYPCLKDLTVADIEQLCNVCSEARSCTLSVRYNYSD